MLKWKYRTCDFCGEELQKSGDLIIKKRWYAYPTDSGWDRLDVCKKCTDRIAMCVSDYFSTTSIRGES